MGKAIKLVDGQTARAQLSLKGDLAHPLSNSYFRAVRVAMGIEADRLFDVSKIRRWLAEHPDFKESSVARPRATCPRVVCGCGREVSVMKGGRTHAHNKPDGQPCEGIRA